MESRVIVVGAGISGLSCARALRERGITALVLERARGVGGRCATRRVEGRLVDHGLPFLHGRDPEFLALLGSVPGATPILGWPRVRLGEGSPCQPEAFGGQDTVLAYREGLTRLPKHLADGLDVRLDAAVTRLRLLGPLEAPEGVEAELASGERLAAAAVVLTMPVPRTLDLLHTLGAIPEALARRIPTLELVRAVPTLTAIALYGADTPAPGWEASLPHDSLLHAILLDSSKREPGAPVTLVIHGRADWSRRRLADPPEAWVPELIEGAARAHGEWIRRPVLAQGHAWRHAMVFRTSELSAPIAVPLGQAWIGLCGDAFDDRGGAEGAHRSSRILAGRLASWIESRFPITRGVPLGPHTR